MNANGYVIGIDMGTGSARAGIFDATGRQVGFGSARWATTHAQPGWAEQDPAEWWERTVEAVHAALTQAAIEPSQIEAISMDATSCTVVCLDADDAITRPAILWMDVRSVQEAERILATGDPALRLCGQGAVSAEWGLPKAMWIKDNEPEVFARTATICDETDWLVHRLTGLWTMSESHAAGKYFYDASAGGWPTSLYKAVGAMDILAKFPAKVTAVGQIVGPLLADVAEELGLPAGIPVVEGGIDAYMGAIGLGVATPGRIALITGSSHVLTGQLDEPVYTRGIWGSFANATVPGYFTFDGGQVSTGVVVEWFLKNLAGASHIESEKTGESVYDILTRQAEQIPIGCDGLLALDHFQGNRAPHFDARSRGMFWGLTLHHTEAHMFRAILESICFGTEAIFEALRSAGAPVEEIIVSGGATNNRLWLQMHADVSNVPLVLTDVTEGPALGSAMVAAVGAGWYEDIPTASLAMTKTAEVIQPDPGAHERYRPYYELYTDSYLQMKDLMARLSEHYSA
ncbi:MAG: FGGY family carbohydrate kinase [Actinomycetaceae bacterium]|nr:FGGY family carbohydrate kinase [Actinomycetaceae bacterium]